MSKHKFSIININAKNVDEYGFFCVKNEKHPGYISKKKWLKKRFKEGLRIKLILAENGKQVGFIEYIPGEYTWRVVEAPDYFVIHCIWVNSKKYSTKGLATMLLGECINDAKAYNQKGVAVVTSDGSWMASKDVYLKNGFEEVDISEPHFQLLVKSFGKNVQASFPKDFEERKKQYKGLQLVYTDQCPYIGKALAELPPVAKKYKADLKLIEIKDSKIAREKMLSPYGMINLIYDGKLLADHAISATRFKNILENDLKLKAV